MSYIETENFSNSMLRKRRHHKQRLRDKRRSDITYHGSNINKHVTTPTVCSCFMCGNPRKFNGNSNSAYTIQEQRQLQKDKY